MSECGAGCGTTTDLYLCRDCGANLVADLNASAWLLGELEVTYARQHRFGALVGSLARSADTPVPYHQKASEVGSALRSELVGWFRVFRGSGCTAERDIAGWLALRVSDIRAHPSAGEMATRIGKAVSDARAVIDRPPDTWYAGPCECGQDLNARSRRGTVECSACGKSYDIDERRSELLAAMEDQLAPTSVLCRALTMLGRELSAEQVRKWASRGKLTQRPPHPGDPKRRPRYRIGDVVDLLTSVDKR